MYIAYVELNLQDGFGEKVRFGPFRFPKWTPRETWESSFRRELSKYGKTLDPPFEFKPEFLFGTLIPQDELMEPPPVRQAIHNLKILWESGAVVPVPSS